MQSLNQWGQKGFRKGISFCLAILISLSSFMQLSPLPASSFFASSMLLADVNIFVEDFENGFANGSNGWSVGDADSYGGTYYWNDVNSTFGGEGTYSGSYKAYASANNSTAYCGNTTTPHYKQYTESYMQRTVDLTNMETARISFWYKMPALANEGSSAYFSVTTGTGSGFTKSFNTPVTQWTEYLADLGAYVGGTVTMRWEFDNLWVTDCPANGEAMYVDYIRVYGSPIGNPVTGDITSVSDTPDPVDAGNQISFTVRASNTGVVAWDQWRTTIRISEMYHGETVIATASATETSDVQTGTSDTLTPTYTIPTTWEGDYQYSVKAEVYYNGAWQEIDYKEVYYFAVNSVISLSLEAYELSPAHPRLPEGNAFTARYYINNPTGSNQTVYLFARARTPAGAYTYLLDSQGNMGVAKTITPGINWYERSAVVYAGAPIADNYGFTWFVNSANSYTGPEITSATNLSAFDVITAPNTPPWIQLTSPQSNVSVLSGQSFTITWEDGDPDNTALINLAYDLNNNPYDGGHAWIVLTLSEDSDGTGDQYVWNTTGVTPNTYYIWAVITDAVNTPVYHVAPGTVTIQPPGDSYEPDNACNQAKSISAGAQQTRSISPAGDDDWVSFTLAQPSNVTLQTSGPSGDTEMWLYASNCSTQLDYDDNDGDGSFSLITQVNLAAGTYYVLVREYGDNAAIDPYYLNFTITSASNIITDRWGEIINAHDITLFGKTYTVFTLKKNDAPDGSEIALPFLCSNTTSCPADPQPTVENLVKDAELAKLILETWQRNLYLSVNSTQKDFFEQVKINTQLDQWYNSNLMPVIFPGPGFTIQHIFTKRKVDRVFLSQTAFWVAGEVPTAVIEAYFTGGVALMNHIPSLILHLYNAGHLDGINENELKAVILAQAEYSGDFDTFRNMQIALAVGEIEEFFDVYHDSHLLLEHVDAAGNLVDYRIAVKAADFDAMRVAKVDFAVGITSLGYEVVSDIVADWANSYLHWDSLEEELKRGAWLHDVHMEAANLTASELITKLDRISALMNGADTPQARAELFTLQSRYMYQNNAVLYPLVNELLGVHIAHAQRILDNVQPTLIANWHGASQDNIDKWTDEYNSVRSESISAAEDLQDYVINKYTAVEAYNAVMSVVSSQETNGLLTVIPADVLEAKMASSTVVGMKIFNEYIYTAQSVVIGNISSGQRTDGITLTGANAGSIAPGAMAAVNVTISVPENIYLVNENKPVFLSIPVTWQVNGLSFSREFLVQVSITPEGYLEKAVASQQIVYPGEIVTIDVNWTALPNRELIVVGKWIKPNGDISGYSWNYASSTSSTIAFQAPSGPYGVYGLEVLVYQQPDIILIPWSYVPHLFYILPPINGSAASLDTQNIVIIYPLDDAESADDIARAFAVGSSSMFVVEENSLADLQNIANSRDTILLGGKAANPLVNTLTTSGKVPNTLQSMGDSYVHIVSSAFNGNDAVVVAGANTRDTMMASIAFIDKVCPEIDVRGNGASIQNEDTVPTTADGTDFGSTNVNGGTVPHYFRIYNLGSSNLNLIGNPKVVVTGTNGTSAAEFAVNPQPASPISAGNYSEFTITFDPNAAGLRSATVTIANTDTDEAPYTFSIQGTGTTTALPAVSFSSSTYPVSENIGSASISVQLSASSAQPVTVTYATSNGTATAGSDYTAASNTLTIPAGQTSGSFNVPILDDALDEADQETVNLTLSAPVNATLGAPSSAVITINDNDNPPTVQFFQASYNAGEGDGSVQLTVTLSAASGRPVSVGYATANGTAASGSDYTAASNTLSIPAGQTSGSFTVAILNDGNIETSEYFSVTLSSTVNSSLGNPGQTWVTIQDNDVVPEIDVRYDANGSSIGDGDVTPTTTDGTDFGSADITSGTVAHLFRIWNVGSADLQLSGTPKVLIGGTNASDFTVTAQPPSPVSANNGSVQFEVVFNPSGTGARTASISIANNDADENPYNFSMQGTGSSTGLQAPINVQATDGEYPNQVCVTWDDDGGIGHIISRSDTVGGSKIVLNLLDLPSYSYCDTSATPGQLYYYWVQACSNRSTCSAYSDYNTGYAGSTTALPEIDIRYDANGVSIADGDLTPTTTDGTDFGSADVTGGTISRLLRVWNTGTADLQLSGMPKVSISGTNASEFTVTAQPASPVSANNGSVQFEVVFNPSGTGTRTATISIANNDTNENPYNFSIQGMGITTAMPTVSFSSSTYPVSENIGSASISVQLSASSAQPVNVTYATSNGTATAGSDYTAASNTLTIPAGQTSGSFNVPILDDALDEAEQETVNLTLSAPVNATLGSPATGSITIVDNDEPPGGTYSIYLPLIASGSSISVLFNDNFSADKGWMDQTNGRFYRDAVNQTLHFDARRSEMPRYFIPISANPSYLQFDFRFKVTSASGNGTVFIGMVENLDAPVSFWGVDATGFFVGIHRDTWYGKKLNLVSNYANGTSYGVELADTPLNYTAYNSWRSVRGVIDGLKYTIDLYDDTGGLIGNLTGILPRSHSNYNYLMIFLDVPSGWESIQGEIDDITISQLP